MIKAALVCKSSDMKLTLTQLQKAIITPMRNLSYQTFLSLYGAHSATLNGTTYRIKDFLVFSINNDEPIFGKIIAMIVSTAKETLFVLQMFHTIHFNMHVHSLEVCGSNVVNVYSLDELLDHLLLNFATLVIAGIYLFVLRICINISLQLNKIMLTITSFMINIT